MRSSWKLSLVIAAAVLPATLQAGWPFTAEGPRRGSLEWYEMHACEPIGQRQKIKFGKAWPAAPRPMGEPTPLVHRYHHNQFWPHPYQKMDYQSVKQFEFLQVANGWEQATTLYEYHFDAETHELNSAGRDHLYWIMASVPPEFRTTYVQMSRTDPSVSSVRLSNVQSEAARFVGDQTPPILLRVAHPVGTPAADVDAIFQYRRDNLSPPPALSGGAGGGGEGG